MSHGIVCHIFVCVNQRDADSPLPSCGGRGSMSVYEAVQKELSRRRWPSGVKVTPTGCLTPCQHGPNIVIYPQGIWYAEVTPGDVAEILAAHLDRKTIVERLLLPDNVRLW